METKVKTETDTKITLARFIFNNFLINPVEKDKMVKHIYIYILYYTNDIFYYICVNIREYMIGSSSINGEQRYYSRSNTCVSRAKRAFRRLRS